MVVHPLIVAHEGCEGAQPHTLESINAGLEAGADMVEVDIRATNDGVVVLSHEATVEVDGRAVAIATLTYEDLVVLRRDKRLSLDSHPFAIARLEEVLDLVRRRGGAINLDVKEEAAVPAAVRTLRATDSVGTAVFSGCELGVARRLKQEYPEVQVLLNPTRERYEQARTDPDRFVRQVCEEAVQAACCGINVRHTHCPEGLVEYARRRYVPVSVWTVDAEEDMQSCLAKEVFSITTNKVRMLRSLANGRGDRPGV